MLTVLSVVVLDQITKYLIVDRMSFSDSLEVFPFLHIVSVRNTGSAFGTFRGVSKWFFVVIAVAAIGFVINLLRTKTYNTFGLSLVLGGAIGNLSDRILYGKVVDFIDVNISNFHWPAFNVADSALTVGIILIFVSSMFGGRLCR